MKKYFNGHHKTLSSGLKLKAPVIFAAIFGLVMIIIGLSQIFAAGSVAFVLQPASQTANANDSRALTVSINSGGQQVDGGKVRLTYDPAQITNVSFTPVASSYVRITNQSGAAGSYTFDYQIFYGSQSSPALGTLTVQAKSISSTQAAYVRFDTANTNAYLGFNPSNRTYYPATYGQSAIVINGVAPPAPTPTPNPTPNPTPPPSPAPTPSPRGTNPSTPPASPNNTALPYTSLQPPDSTISPAGIPGSNPDTSEVPPTSSSSYYPYNPPGAAVKPKTKKIAPLAIIVLILGILLLGGAAFIYLKYIRDKPAKLPHKAEDLSSGLFDDKPPVSAEEILIAPTITDKKLMDGKNASEQAPEQHPPIITKSGPKEHADTAGVTGKQPEHAHISPAHTVAKSVQDKLNTPLSSLQEKPAVSPAAGPKPVSPAPPIPTVQASGPVPAKPSVPSSVSKPGAQQHPAPWTPPPTVPPPLVPAAAFTPPFPPAKKPAADPAHIVPEWQSRLNVAHAAPKDDPPDMFELAEEHPESFGSSQLYESEHPKDKPDNEKDKK